MKLCGFEGRRRAFRPAFPHPPACGPGSKVCLDVAGTMKEICAGLAIPYIFKASTTKGNRISSPVRQETVRGHGMSEGLKILETVRGEADPGVPVLTDAATRPSAEVAAVVDVLQTPAFLCRQTDFIHAVCGERQAGEYQEGPVPRPR